MGVVTVIPSMIALDEVLVTEDGCTVDKFVTILRFGTISPLITIAGVVSIFSCASMSVTKR